MHSPDICVSIHMLAELNRGTAAARKSHSRDIHFGTTFSSLYKLLLVAHCSLLKANVVLSGAAGMSPTASAVLRFITERVPRFHPGLRVRRPGQQLQQLPSEPGESGVAECIG